MASIASQARINLGSFRGDRSVDEDSPLEDQVALVHQAALHYAKANHFDRITNVHKSGLQGQLVMSQVVGSLFPRVSGDDLKTLRSLIYQVLRNTRSAVCVFHSADTTPTWWISETEPKNLTVAVAYAKNRGARTSMAQTETERKLTPEEAGETVEPGPVTVSQRNPAEHLKGQQHVIAERHQRLLKRILEEIATNPQPLSSNDLHAILSEETGMVSTTTFSSATAKLVEAGELVFRKETADEARVRGGGEMPLATRPRLYAIAPGPVPTRTAIPDGVTASPSAREIHDRSAAERQAARTAAVKEQRERCETAVLTALARRGLSIGELCDELEIRSGAERAFLIGTVDRLVQEGRVVHRNGRKFLAEGPGASSLETDVKDTLAEVREAQEARVSDDNDNKLERLLAAAQAYTESIATADSSAHDALAEENADLKRQVAELEAKVAKQKAAIDALS